MDNRAKTHSVHDLQPMLFAFSKVTSAMHFQNEKYDISHQSIASEYYSESFFVTE